MVPPELLGPATLSITQSVGLFQAFLPRFSDIRRTTKGVDPALDRDIRMGEIAASSLAIGIGVIVSNLTGSATPITVSLVCCIGLISLYEYALHTPGEVAASVN